MTKVRCKKKQSLKKTAKTTLSRDSSRKNNLQATSEEIIAIPKRIDCAQLEYALE
jgi:hypothetical protein